MMKGDRFFFVCFRFEELFLPMLSLLRSSSVLLGRGAATAAATSAQRLFSASARNPSAEGAPEASKEEQKRFLKTVNLPKTPFTIYHSAKREKEMIGLCASTELYRWQEGRTDDDGVPLDRFILHDGPPFANGDLHIGHALNKLVKDFTNRFKLLRGFRVK